MNKRKLYIVLDFVGGTPGDSQIVGQSTDLSKAEKILDDFMKDNVQMGVYEMEVEEYTTDCVKGFSYESDSLSMWGVVVIKEIEID